MSRSKSRRKQAGTPSVPRPWHELVAAATPLVHQHGAASVAEMLERTAAEVRAAEPTQRGSILERAGRGPLGPLLSAAAKAPRRGLTAALLPAGVGILALSAVSTPGARTASSNGTGPAAADDLLDRSLEIPIRDHRLGPMSRARQRRAVTILAAIQAIGLSQMTAKSPQRQAAGLGVMVPGGGFLYTKDPALFVLSVAAAATGLVAWIGTGNHLATPAAWLGAAALASHRASEEKRSILAMVAVPLAVAGLAESLRRKYKQDYVAQVEAAKQTNMLLSVSTPPLRGSDRPEVFVGPELTDDELAMTRHLVDVALQDPDDWSNFNIVEQFQPSAVRYQINGLGWALATQQYSRMPAFRGYLSEAQRNLIERYQQRKVWSYWFLENIWGNLELNPDPVRKQNVMLSGFFGLQIATYQSATGDRRYTEPGSIKFRWSKDRTYDYSFTSICEAMASDLEKSPWGLIVCEPNWVYAYCNTTAGNSFLVHDRMEGTGFWPRVRDGFVRGMEEEMSRVDGLMHSFKSTRVGLAEGKAPGPSTVLRPLVPHLADRSWALMQAGGWMPGEDGKLQTAMRGAAPGLDFGNYDKNNLTGYAFMLDAAREVGDEERAMAAWNELLETAPHKRDNGRLIFDGSLQSNLWVARGAFSRKAGWLDLITKGRPAVWDEGPILESVPYERVLVARAENDAKSLDFVLRGRSGSEPIIAELSNLQAGKSYNVNGAVSKSFKASDDGTAQIKVTVDDRAEVRVTLAD